MGTRDLLGVLARFLRLALEPAKWAWNLIGAGAAGIVGVASFLNHHAFGIVMVLAGVMLLLLVAGVRLQGRLDVANQYASHLSHLGT